MRNGSGFPAYERLRSTNMLKLKRTGTWLVDWSGSPRALQVMAFWLRTHRVLQRQPDEVLLAAPGGSISRLEIVMRGVPYRSLDRALDPERRSEIDRWVLQRSWDLTSDARLFPCSTPVPLGPLSLLPLQDELKRFAEFRLVADTVGPSAIFSLDPALAAALTDAVRECRPALGTGLLRLGRRWGGRATISTPTADAAPSNAIVSRAREFRDTDALLVSWTRPMDEMFAAVANQLECRRSIKGRRLHFGFSCDPRVWCEDFVDAAERRSDGRLAVRWPDIERSLEAGTLEGPEAAIVASYLETAYAGTLDVQVAYLKLVVEVLELIKPKVVAVGNDRTWLGLSWVLCARELGIPTLCVQDGTAGDMPQWRWLSADRIAVTGRHLQELLADEGYAVDRMIVTGQPRYDSLLKKARATDQESPRQNLAANPEAKRSVLFTTQYGQDPRFVRDVVEAILRVPRVHLILRPHPSESMNLHQELANEQQERISLERETSIEDLLCAADVLVARNSTVVLEARIIGLPVVVADFSGRALPEQMVGIGAHIASDPSAVTEQVKAALKVGSRGKPVNDPIYLGPLDAFAGDRVASEIVRLAEEGASIGPSALDLFGPRIHE